MGCCCSYQQEEPLPTAAAASSPSSSTPNRPAAEVGPSGVAAAAAAAAANEAEPPPPRGRRGSRDRPLEERYNRPLRLPTKQWASKEPIATAELNALRREFWETRVTGSAEVWGALRAAVELLRMGDEDTARVLVEAAGVNVPTGNLSMGAYDEPGHRYIVPDYCLTDPTNIVLAGSMAKEAATALKKGKMLAGMERELTVKVRLSTRGGTDLSIKMEEGDTVENIVEKVAAEAELDTGETRISLVYLGKMLEKNKTLVEQGWKSGDCVNALVLSKM